MNIDLGSQALCSRASVLVHILALWFTGCVWQQRSRSTGGSAEMLGCLSWAHRLHPNSRMGLSKVVMGVRCGMGRSHLMLSCCSLPFWLPENIIEWAERNCGREINPWVNFSSSLLYSASSSSSLGALVWSQQIAESQTFGEGCSCIWCQPLNVTENLGMS